MAAMRCTRCKVNWGSHVSECRICLEKDQMLYRGTAEPSTAQEIRAAELEHLRKVEAAESDHRTDRVVNWRFECLLDAGAPPEVADLVAGWKVDLHFACGVFRAGCDPQLAQQILSPVE